MGQAGLPFGRGLAMVKSSASFHHPAWAETTRGVYRPTVKSLVAGNRHP